MPPWPACLKTTTGTSARVHRHHRLPDRHGLERRGLLRNDRRAVVEGHLHLFVRGGDDIACCRRGFRPAAGVMLLEAPLVAAEPLLDAFGGAVEAQVSILRAAFGVKHDAGIEMDGAVGPESRPFGLERHMAGEAAIEIFAQRRGDTLLDMGAKGIADIEVLSGNAQNSWRLGTLQPSLVLSRARGLFDPGPCVGVSRDNHPVPWPRQRRGAGPVPSLARRSTDDRATSQPKA